MARRRRGERRDWQVRLYLRLTILFLAIAYAIAFVIKNNKDTSIDFVFSKTKVSRSSKRPRSLSTFKSIVPGQCG